MISINNSNNNISNLIENKKNNNDEEISPNLNNANKLPDSNANSNISPKNGKNNNKKNSNKKIKEEVIEIVDDESVEMSQPYIKKVVENKSSETKMKNKKNKNKEKDKNKVKEDTKQKDNNIEIKIKNINNNQINNIKTGDKHKEQDNKNNNNNNLSFSSNNDKGNFNQVLFDYKNYQDNKPIKRKSDNLDDEELKEIKNQKDLVNKQKKKGWIQKEEIKKEIKLESFVNENIKKNKELNNSEMSLLSLGKLNEEEANINKKSSDLIKDKNAEEKQENEKVNKNNESNNKLNNINNSYYDLLLLDKFVDNNTNSINSFSNLNSLNNINIINNKSNINNASNKKSQEGFDLDFNSNVQSKDKSYKIDIKTINEVIFKNKGVEDLTYLFRFFSLDIQGKDLSSEITEYLKNVKVFFDNLKKTFKYLRENIKEITIIINNLKERKEFYCLMQVLMFVDENSDINYIYNYHGNKSSIFLPDKEELRKKIQDYFLKEQNEDEKEILSVYNYYYTSDEEKNYFGEIGEKKNINNCAFGKYHFNIEFNYENPWTFIME